MTKTIFTSNLEGSINIISSKSISHRYVIAAALSSNLSKIENTLQADDLDATISALKLMGANIDLPYVSGPLQVLEDDIIIDCMESGSTLRFLIPFSFMLNKDIIYTGRNRLPKRPLTVYEELASEHGLKYEELTEDYLPLRAGGKLSPGIFEIDGNISSQFVTGLMFVLPLLEGDSKIIFRTPLESIGYVNLTIDTLKDFGIEIKEIDNGYLIKGNQTYNKVNKKIEGDFSQAAFFIVAAILASKEKLILKDLNKNSRQGDMEVIDIVKRMGAKVKWDNDDLIVYKSLTTATTVDLKDIPDLGPILMVLAAFSKGETTFKNVDRLRIKESDRLEAMLTNFDILNIEYVLNKDEVVIKGVNEIKGDFKLKTFRDHRIVMALTVLGLKVKGSVTLLETNYVNKSYPIFFEEITKLGGVIKWSKI